jgi:TIR domain
MSYNLTESQKDLVRWLVREVRAKRLSEEFWVYWVSEGGGFIGEYEGGKHHSITQGALDALTISNLIHSEPHFESFGESSRRCVLLGRVFEAVDSDFGTVDTPLVQRLSTRADSTDQTTRTAVSKPVKLFYSYSHKDERHRERLEAHLSLLKREGILEEWHDRKIVAGQTWEEVLDENLETSDVVVLLVSSDFIASDYCYEKEMKRALERHGKGESKVIPVIVRPSDWQRTPFSKLQALPRDAKAITKWKNRDDAWLSVAQGIREAIDELRAKPLSDNSSLTKQSKLSPSAPNRHSEDVQNLPASTIASVSPDSAFDELLPTLRQKTTLPIMLPAKLPDKLKNVALDAGVDTDSYTIVFFREPLKNNLKRWGRTDVVEHWGRTDTYGVFQVRREPESRSNQYFEATSVEEVKLSDGIEARLRYMEPLGKGAYGPYWEAKFYKHGTTYTIIITAGSKVVKDEVRQVLSTMVSVT